MSTDNTSKERQIIRQSQIKLALDYFHSCGVCPTSKDLIRTTTLLEDYIFNGYSKSLSDRFEKLDEYISENYLKSGKDA